MGDGGRKVQLGGHKPVFNAQAKISGAISIAFSELPPPNKGEFDPLQ